MSALLFDLGGTFLRAGILNGSRTVENITKRRISSVAHGLAAAVIWERVTASILAYEAAQRSRLTADAPIVISFPGPIATGMRILQAPTVSGGSNGLCDFAKGIEQSTRRRTVLLNDVSAAAWRLAEMSDVRTFLVVTVSSGIGSKIFYREHPSGVLDDAPYAGEIGHIVVDDRCDAPMCDCGGRGHLGAIASGRGIERLAREKASTYPSDFRDSLICRRFGATHATLNNEAHIVPAVLAGDSWASHIVRDCTRPLARALLTVAMSAGLERVFIMGGFANALGPCYMQIIRSLALESGGCREIREQVGALFEAVPPGSEISLEGCAAFLRSSRRPLRQ